MCVCVRVCVCLCVYTHTHKDINTYIHAYVHTYIYTYITYIYIHTIYKVKWSRYKPSVAQGVGRGIALLFHDRSTRRRWVVSSTLWPHFTPGKDTVPILQEGGWAPGPVWKGGKSCTHRDSFPDRPAHSQSLYRLSYPAHTYIYIYIYIYRNLKLTARLTTLGICIGASMTLRRGTSLDAK